MILNALYGLEYFQVFDPFYYGLGGSIYLFILLWIFNYLGARGFAKKPTEVALEQTVIVYAFGFFLHVTGMHPFITGVLTLAAYLAVIKINAKMPWVPFSLLNLYFLVVFVIMAFAEPLIRNILLLFALGAIYIKGDKIKKQDKKQIKKQD
jgi:uncharacterized membrane protein